MGWSDKPKALYQAPDSEVGTEPHPMVGQTGPTMVGGKTLEEFMALGPQGMKEYQYGPEMEAEYGAPGQLWEEQPAGPLVLWDETVEEAKIADNIRANRAHAESILQGDPNVFDQSFDENADGTVMSEVAKYLLDKDAESQISVFINDPTLTVDQKIEAMKWEIERQDYRTLSPYTQLLFQYMLTDEGALTPIGNVNAMYKNIDPLQIRAMRDRHVEQMFYRGRRVVEDWAAEQGFVDYSQMFVEAGVQDFLPIYNILSRIGINQTLLEASGAKIEGGWRNVFPGEVRNTIRNHLISLSSEEFLDTVVAMRSEIERLQRDPVLGKLMTQYGALEAWEAIFTEDLLNASNAQNTIDRWIGNLDVALESLLMLPVLSKFAGKGLRSAFRATDSMAARSVARSVGNTELTKALDEALQNDVRGSKFQVSAEEAVVPALPRPASLADDIDRLPAGARAVLDASEARREEILSNTAKLTGRGLTAEDKANTTRRLLDDISLNDKVEVMPAMSVVRPLQDDAGIEITATLGQTAERGWNDLDELIDDILELDPNLDQFTIVRVNEQGTLSEVISREDLRNFIYRRSLPANKVDDFFATEEYFLQYKQQRYWHPLDKDFIPSKGLSSVGKWFRGLLNPNARFGSDIAKSINLSYMDEQWLMGQFEAMFDPYYKLAPNSRRNVSAAYEWSEDFGKTNGRAPTVDEILAAHADITTDEIEGLIALRSGMDTMYELFNRKLYREWKSQGFQTIRPLEDASLPKFSGVVYKTADEAGAGLVYDPVDKAVKQFSKKQLRNMYNSGEYVVMKLDMPVDAGSATNKSDRILVNRRQYDVGDLELRPLKYHPGYHFRFYEDPYFIVKREPGYLNGKKTDDLVEAVRTAGSQAEAERWVERANFAQTKRKRKGTFHIVRARDLNQTESSLYMKQTLNREGRLFWDERDAVRLPDVNGNRARVLDPVQAMEKGIAQAARQLTQEDPVRALKEGLKKQYGDLLGGKLTENMVQLDELSKRLAADINNSAEEVTKRRLREAKELVDYIRMIQGTDAVAIPKMRAAIINMSNSIHRWINRGVGRRGKVKGAGVSRAVELYAEKADPFAAMRGVAFTVFMKFRPIRQAIMQGAQIGFLTGLAPKYVGTGRIFMDALGLRHGFQARRKYLTAAGINDSKVAKKMGLSLSEYHKLVKEFERSGLIDTVDVHSFAGGARRPNKVADPGTSVAGQAAAGLKAGWDTMTGFLQKIGFNAGESANQYLTYMLALRRYMDKNKIKSVLDIPANGWDAIRYDTTNLTLGMTRVNSFGYQTGVFSMATQFLSFSHKSMLAMMGLNPAIKGKDVAKLWAGTMVLYGANQFGVRDYVREHLKAAGVDQYGDRLIPGYGASIVDLISAGLIENIINGLGNLTAEDWKDLDASFLAPGVDFGRLYDMQIEAILSQPVGKVFLGPFGNIFSRSQTGYEFAHAMMEGLPGSDEEKLKIATESMLAGIIPQYNDWMQAKLAYKMGKWFTNAGEPMPIRATLNTIIARGLMGVRSLEETAYYDTQSELWENEREIDDIVKKNQLHLRKFILLYRDNQITKDVLIEQMRMMSVYIEDAPDGVKQEILERSFIEKIPGEDRMSVFQLLMDAVDKGVVTPDIIERIDTYSDIPEQHRQLFKQMAYDAWNDRVNREQQLPQHLQNEALEVERR